ncbi:hypothetical protein VTP01DRAFT_3616 [Rhizomucor pusillus]|uniref:uncharacterized protein n=1 Tax=Rhizomucor pusillus TaxID=4840 RepID=UPI0037425F0B
MKRTRAWSKKGLIKVSLRIPKPSKKRKAGQESGYLSTGTVMGHYLSFLKDTLDEMDKYPQMKGHYLVMHNAPIHNSEDIAKYITSGLSLKAKLNAIDFWKKRLYRPGLAMLVTV